MENQCLESISSRTQRLRQKFLGLSVSATQRPLMSTETLLDSLCLMYKEFDSLAHRDSRNVTAFLNRFERLIAEVDALRVKVADFSVMDLIGRGQFGKVHLVREKASGVLFAMKSIDKKDILPEKRPGHFEEERDIMAVATSPWLVTLHYAFQDSEKLYFVMDYVPGGDLLGLLNREYPLTEGNIRFYLAETALAIHTLHQMGYVHRDIKPENLLLDRLGHLRLTDFGSAVQLDPVTKTYPLDTPVGTEEYVAPEALLGNGRKGERLGPESDYWGLGVLGYQLFYNVTPFESELTRNTYHKIMKFRDFVKYPSLESGQALSCASKSLLESLLTEKESRLDHGKFCQHPFFESINWNSLRDASAPFVPVLSCEADVSNFGSFERDKEDPRGGEGRSFTPDRFALARVHANFSTRDLPFVGMTFTRSTEESATRISNRLSKQISGSSILAMDEKSVARELGDLRKKLALSEEEKTTKNRTIQSLKSDQKRLEEVLRLKDEKILHLSKELAGKNQEIERLETELIDENTSRQEMETKAMDLIRGAKERWKKEEEKRMSNLQTKLEKCKAELAGLYDDHSLCIPQRQELQEYLKETLAAKIDLSKEVERLKVELSHVVARGVNSSKLQMADESLNASVLSPAKRIIRGIEASVQRMNSDLEEIRREPKLGIRLSSSSFLEGDFSSLDISAISAVSASCSASETLHDTSERTQNSTQTLIVPQASDVSDGVSQEESFSGPVSDSVEINQSQRSSNSRSRRLSATFQMDSSDIHEGDVTTPRERRQHLSFEVTDLDKTSASRVNASASETPSSNTMTMSVELADLPSVHVRWQDLEDARVKEKGEHEMIAWGPEEQKKMEALVRRNLKRDREVGSLKERILNLEARLEEAKMSYEGLNAQLVRTEKEYRQGLEEAELEIQRLEQIKIDLEAQVKSQIRNEVEMSDLRASLDALNAKLIVSQEKESDKKEDVDLSSIRQSERVKLLEEQITRLEAQLEANRDAASAERTKAELVERELITKEKALSNAAIDLRMAERERNDVEKELKGVRENERRWLLEKKDLQAQVENVSVEKKDAVEEISRLKVEFTEMKTSYQAIKASLEAQIEKLNDQISSQRAELVLLKKDLSSKELWERQRAAFEEKLEVAGLEKKQLLEKLQDTERKIGETRSELEQTAKQLARLNSHSKLMEDEVNEVDAINAKLAAALKASQNKIDELTRSVSKVSDELEKEKSSLKEANATIQLLENRLEAMKNEMADTNSEYRDMQMAQNADRDTLLMKLEKAQKQCAELQMEVRSSESQRGDLTRSIESITDELMKKREEVAHLRLEVFDAQNEVKSLQKENNSLSAKLDDADISIQKLLEELESHRGVNEALRDEFARFRLMKDSAIEQHTKLIFHLQESQNMKKKGHGIFGSSTSSSSCKTPNAVTKSFYEITVQLEKERNKVFALTSENNTLQEELARARGKSVQEVQEITRRNAAVEFPPSARRALAPTFLSPKAESEAPKEQQFSQKRLKHNIPHKFQSQLTMRPVKCAGCLGSVPFARMGAKCLTCGVVAHPSCSEKINAESPFCGLTPQMVLKVEELQKENLPGKPPRIKEEDIKQGEVKLRVPGEKKWEGKYLVLTDDTLHIYQSSSDVEAVKNPSRSIHLNPIDGFTSVVACISGDELSWVNSTDLSFVFKLERFECGDLNPKETCYVMALSFVDKIRWVDTLEKLCRSGTGDASALEDELAILQPKPVATIPVECGEILSCTTLSSSSTLYGTKRGLFACRGENSSPRLILELAGGVFQMKPIPHLSLLLLINGEEHSLSIISNLESLTTAASTSSSSCLATASQVSPLEHGLVHVHLFDVMAGKDGKEVTVIAAQEKLLHILRWDWERMEFRRAHRVKLFEGACALTMRDHSVIVASDNFYEVDLSSGKVESFLDEGDDTLWHVTRTSYHRCVPLKVYPVGPREFLVCFHELAIFVDSYGARSRKEDLRYSRLPVTIEYQAPYLYVFHFNAIEVFKLKRDTCMTTGPKSRTLDLPQPLFLGVGLAVQGESAPIFVSSPKPNREAIDVFSVKGRSFFRLDSLESLPLTDSESVDPCLKRSFSCDDSASSEFTFTSSINEAMDQVSATGDDEPPHKKRVTFRK